MENDTKRPFHAGPDPAEDPEDAQRSAPLKGLADPLGITLTAVAQQLRLLEASDLVRTEKLGRVRTCRLEPAGLEVAQDWLGGCRTSWQHKLDRLAEYLDLSDDEDGPPQ
jgi:DNA-binding transcriptional ArsR family regulator